MENRKNMYRIVLAGNPNVGKSTVFNALTGRREHTGTWPGKTVQKAIGYYSDEKNKYEVIDLPGTYSLLAHSEEEEVARDYICFEDYDVAVVVLDAITLERNLNLALQIMENAKKVILCVNLLDEARKRHVRVNIYKLKKIFNVPVIGTSARKKEGLEELKEEIKILCEEKKGMEYTQNYGEFIDHGVFLLETALKETLPGIKNSHFLSLCLLEKDQSFLKSIEKKYPILKEENIIRKIQKAKGYLLLRGVTLNIFRDQVVSAYMQKSSEVSKKCVCYGKVDYTKRERVLDSIFTSKRYGIPLMILLFLFIFWITIEGANIPSNFLFHFFEKLEAPFFHFTQQFFPNWFSSLLVFGVYRTLTWIVSVMLPPMAIFFPLFTLLEDFGYLPRIAFNLDHYFERCHACGKQALTMCMGFGCNAVGVTGARIIDSKRERLLAILTNVFVPCNGRFPTILAMITMFFVGFRGGIKESIFSAFFLTFIIFIGIGLTFLVSFVLSKTLLKGEPSHFILELPPYRMPQFGKVLKESIFNRTIFVLGRAVSVAIPAGFLIWSFANVKLGNTSLLLHISHFLDPFGHLIGLDGVILLSFILGFPANEIVIPIMIMTYMQTGQMTEFQNLNLLKDLLLQNGWTMMTAICMTLFCLVHFPCSTTFLTIKKETGSRKWAILGFLLPTLIGLLLCFFVATVFRLFNFLF